MSWLEDKIKGWEASDDAGWLRAQLEVIALELAAAESRLRDAEAREAEGKDGFEAWLRKVCFQQPTPEAYDLAKCAWLAALPARSAAVLAVLDAAREQGTAMESSGDLQPYLDATYRTNATVRNLDKEV